MILDYLAHRQTAPFKHRYKPKRKSPLSRAFFYKQNGCLFFFAVSVVTSLTGLAHITKSHTEGIKIA